MDGVYMLLRLLRNIVREKYEDIQNTLYQKKLNPKKVINLIELS